MKLSKNTILLTGGTSGIGLALLQRLYTDNKMIVTSGSKARLEKLQAQFPGITGIVCDLAQPDAVQSLIQTCLSSYQDINILINNAGIQHNYLFPEEKDGYQKIAEEITVNLTSPLHLIYGLLPLLLNKPQAAIVNVSSGLIFSPKRSASVYCGSKAAIHISTKALRYQLENTPVKVFEIIPPLVDTPMTAGRGRGKIPPEVLVQKFMKNFERDTYESNIGKTKLLRMISRIAPSLADRILKNE